MRYLGRFESLRNSIPRIQNPEKHFYNVGLRKKNQPLLSKQWRLKNQ